MGREARCACRWGARNGVVTVHLDASTLVVRGDFHARLSLASVRDVMVRGDDLMLVGAGENVAFELGAATARLWARALAQPPPSLASKIGIDATTRLCVIGRLDDEALRGAVARADARDVALRDATLAIVRTDDRADLEAWAARVSRDGRVPPVWIVYRKGRNAPLGEAAVREIMRAHDFVDTKVAAVSDRLTALKFARRSSRTSP